MKDPSSQDFTQTAGFQQSTEPGRQSQATIKWMEFLEEGSLKTLEVRNEMRKSKTRKVLDDMEPF